MRRGRQFAYTITARGQVVLYNIEPAVIERTVDSGKWNIIGRKHIFSIEFLRKRALFTVKFIDYKEYILILSIHKTTSRNAIKKAKSK